MKNYDIDKEKLIVRMHRVQGQLAAVNTMIENDAKCQDVLMQLSAATAALHSLAVIVAREHVNKEIHESVKIGTEEGAMQQWKIFLVSLTGYCVTKKRSIG